MEEREGETEGGGREKEGHRRERKRGNTERMSETERGRAENGE